MTQSLYIASLEANSGKLLISLGVMEMLSREIDRVGFFRPVSSANAEHDSHIQLLCSRFNLSMTAQQMVGVTHEQAREWLSQGDDQRLFREIIARFKQAEATCDFLLCEGPDITLLSDALDYSMSVRIAKSLGAPAIYVSSGHQISVSDLLENVQLAKKTFKKLSCPLLAVLVNRLNPEILPEAREALLKDQTQQTSPLLTYLLPEIEGLSDPAMEEIVDALNARWFSGPKDRLQPISKWPPWRRTIF